MIVSAISYMLLGPMSLSRIQPSMLSAKATNMRDTTSVTNAIKVDAADEINIANNRIAAGPAAAMATLTTNIESV